MKDKRCYTSNCVKNGFHRKDLDKQCMTTQADTARDGNLEQR